jgi:hypothetical protein
MEDERPQSLLTFLGNERAEPQQSSAHNLLSCDNVRDFCRGILSSREYRQSVLDRIIIGQLAPAVECRFYDYAYGKPVERVEFKDTTDPLDDFTAEQLEDRAAKLLEVARQLRLQQQADGEPAESVH